MAFDRVLRRPDQHWEIRQCRRCSFGWTWPSIPEEQIGSFYPPSYLGDTTKALDEFHRGDLQKSRSWKKETEKVRLVERFAPGGRILDVGCADGKFLWALDGSRWQRHGVEFSESVVRTVQSRFPEIRFLAGDVFHPSLEHEQFDVVTLWHVLEHLPQPHRVASRLADLLKPGGVLVLSLPNLDSLQAVLFRRHWYGFDDVPRHLFHYSPEALRILLDKAGLRMMHRCFFSKIVNFHCLKYSLVNWSESRTSGRLPYYALKPLLFLFPLLEQLTGKYGIHTVVAHKPVEPPETTS